MDFRPEDSEVIAEGRGLFDTEVHAVEMTGEQTLITIQLHGEHFVIKISKDFDAEIGRLVGMRFTEGNGCLFDTGTGERLSSCTVGSS